MIILFSVIDLPGPFFFSFRRMIFLVVDFIGDGILFGILRRDRGQAGAS